MKNATTVVATVRTAPTRISQALEEAFTRVSAGGVVGVPDSFSSCPNWRSVLRIDTKEGRSRESFSRHCITSRFSPVGMLVIRVEGSGGMLLTIWLSRATWLSGVKGRRPVNDSYRTAPRLQMSVAGPNSSPSACSGLM